MDTAAPVQSFEELEHPGQIFYLDKISNASQVYGIFQTPKKFFAKMLLRDEMLASHSVAAYEKAFANVDLGKYFFLLKNPDKRPDKRLEKRLDKRLDKRQDKKLYKRPDK